MKRNFPIEFVYQLFALLIAFIAVHALYVTLIRPQAAEIMEEQRVQMQENENFVPDRSVYVVIRDYEQEACFVLFVWALFIIAFKMTRSSRESGLIDRHLMPVGDGISILPEDAREYARPIQALQGQIRNYLLPRVLISALHRFRSTAEIQSVASTVHELCESESERLESELSMVRYIAWAIPSIGFIGTVRGIGEALSHANQAVQGDISGVTENLGVAFNSTFVALILSIILMFIMHQLQLMQERLVLNTREYVDDSLITKLRES